MRHMLRTALAMVAVCHGPELLAGQADVGQVAPRSPRATVAVDCGATHSRVPLTGFLHGCYGASEEEMLRLRPRYWRSPDLANLGLMARLGVDLSVDFTYVVDNQVVAVNADNADAYVAYVKQKYRQYRDEAARTGARMKYWEFWNEGEGLYVWQPMVRGEKVEKMEAFFRAFRLFHDAIREEEPGALLIAPSSNHFWSDLMEDFLARCDEAGLRLDAVAWHVIDHRPEEIPEQVAFVRGLIERHPGLGVKGIHLNEWGWPGIGTGSQMAYLHYMERAGVSLAAKSIWGVEPLDDLFTPDGLVPERVYENRAHAMGSGPLPRVSYWAWVSYAMMGPVGCLAESSDPSVVCLAAPDRDDPSVLRIILARMTKTRLYTSDPTNQPARLCPLIAPPLDVTLSVAGLPDGAVGVEIARLPNTDWAMAEDVYRSFVTQSEATTEGGRLRLGFDGMEDEQVFLVSVRQRTAQR